jgi:hypothetical protein
MAGDGDFFIVFLSLSSVKSRNNGSHYRSVRDLLPNQPPLLRPPTTSTFLFQFYKQTKLDRLSDLSTL